MRTNLWISAGLATAALMLSAAMWSQVPSPMPVHWNAAGQPDGWAARVVGLLLMPAIIALLTPFLGWITRRGIKTERGLKAADIISYGIATFMLAVHVLMLHAATSAGAVMSVNVIMALMGALFALLGAVMPMLPQNKVAGVRTPWTLGSETNWNLTHRFGGWSMAIGGVSCIIISMFATGEIMFGFAFGAIMAGALAPVAYSYVLHRAAKNRP